MELLQRRKFCREFLNGYNEKLHPQIVSRVFEIGLLTLKKMFNKLLFSKEELDEIIKSLSGKEYVEIFPLKTIKNNIKYQDKDTNGNNNVNPKEKCCINEEEELRKKILKNKLIHKRCLQNPNFTTQNKEIYPFWWWNNKDENFDDMPKTMSNNINLTYDENDFNKAYFNNESNNININNNDYNEDYYQQQNYNYMNLPQESNNIDIKQKNYCIKSLNAKKQDFKNNPGFNNNNGQMNQLIKNHRVHSARAAPITNNININNQRENFKIKKINNNYINKENKRRNNNIQEIPKFNNRRVIKIKDEMNNVEKINMINITEPNNNN